MSRTARDFEELYFLVQDETYAPRAKKGDVIVADPKAPIAIGDEVIAAYADGRVLYALVLARCEDGALNARTPGGDCYRLVPGQVTMARVTSRLAHPYIRHGADVVTEGIRAGLRGPDLPPAAG